MKFNVNHQDLQQALNYCQGVIGECDADVITVFVDNDNIIPIIQVSSPLPSETIRAEEEDSRL